MSKFKSGVIMISQNKISRTGRKQSELSLSISDRYFLHLLLSSWLPSMKHTFYFAYDRQ